jgi:hypothetical protein
MSRILLAGLLGINGSIIATVAPAADDPIEPVCRILLDAMSKSVRGPVRAYTTIGNPSDGTAPGEIESITIGDITYTKIRGEWKVSKTKPLMEEFIEQMTLHPEPVHYDQERDEPLRVKRPLSTR